VIISDHPETAINDIIEGSFSYNVTNTVAGMDTTPGSQITATLPNGLIAKTSLWANPFIDIYSNIMDYNNGIFQRDITFSGQSHESNTTDTVNDIGLFFNELFYYQPEELKTEWSKDLSRYESAEFYININGQYVIANIVEVTTNRIVTPPPPAVEEPFTTYFQAKVLSSNSPHAIVDEIIEGSLSYAIPQDNSFQAMFSATDVVPGSEIKATLANGMTVKTAYSANPFLSLNSYAIDHQNGNYQRQMNFSSHQNTLFNNGFESGWPMVNSIDLSFDENFTQAPLAVKTEWSANLTDYNNAEFHLMIDGQDIIAQVITLSTNQEQTVPEPVPEVSLNVALVTNSVPSEGGDLQISASINNVTELAFEVKQWHYISMPNGIQFPISLPTSMQLVALENNQNSTSFSIPSYWSSGNYTYHVVTLTVGNGDIAQSSTSFVKLN